MWALYSILFCRKKHKVHRLSLMKNVSLHKLRFFEAHSFVGNRSKSVEICILRLARNGVSDVLFLFLWIACAATCANPGPSVLSCSAPLYRLSVLTPSHRLSVL